MGTVRKKGKPKKKADNGRRERILAVGQQIFAEKGFLKTTISDITARSEVPEASIYEYFSNKENILFSLAEAFFQELKENLQVHFLGVEGVENRFRKLIWHYLYYFQEHPEFCRIYVTELLYNPRYNTSAAYCSAEQYRRELCNILAEGVECGCFGAVLDLQLCEKMVFGAMNHMILSKIVLDKPQDYIVHAEGLCTLFFHAISTDSYPIKETITGESGKRKSILTAALSEFTEKGFQQTTISKIAKKARVTEPTIYEHFKNKEELLYSIPKAAMGHGSLLDSIDSDLDNMDTPSSRLRMFMAHQIRSVRDYSAYYYLLTTELRGNLGFYGSSHYRSLREYASRLTNILKDGMEEDYFRKDIDLLLVRDLFFGLMDELTLSLSIKKEQHQIVRASEDIFDLIHNAVKVPAV